MSTAGDPPSEELRVRRLPDRGRYDRRTIDAILDEGYVAHVGLVRDGRPVVIPMFYVRDGDRVLLHGSPASGLVRHGGGGAVCVTVTHLDGLVLARSAFHHSMNYRSVVVMGDAVEVTDLDERRIALDRFVERLVPGRLPDLRPMTTKEVRATGVLEVGLAQASAKIRTGNPVDDDEDYALPIWAGVVPMSTVLGPAADDGRVLPGVGVPPSVAALG